MTLTQLKYLISVVDNKLNISKAAESQVQANLGSVNRSSYLRTS